MGGIFVPLQSEAAFTLCPLAPPSLHFPSIALHSRMICAVLLAVQYIKSFRDWVEPELPPPSLNPGSGWGIQWSAHPDQCIPWPSAGPRAALPMRMAQEGAPGSPKPNIGMTELPFLCLNSLVFGCLQLALVRNQELPPLQGDLS